jgi:drug/metabolite transporter (DMT)-like permease
LAPEALATAQVSLAAITLLPFFLNKGITKYEFKFGPVIAMLALGILGTGYAYIWNFRILAAAGSAIASSVTYVTPVVAVIVGVLFLSESVTWNEPIGGVIVLLGAAVGQGRIKINRA